MTETLKNLEGLEIRENESLSSYTGFRTGGPATVLLPKSEKSFIDTLSLLRTRKEHFFILGNGSNVMAPDEGFDGYVVLTKEALTELTVSDGTITAGAGTMLATVCRSALDNGLSGLEFAFGIPGSVGGAVYMNAGAYGGEIVDVIESVKILDEEGRIRILKKEELGLSYRHSIFQKEKTWIILSATFRLTEKEPALIHEEMYGYLARRVEKQPLDSPSCGSTFKRPKGSYASKLIDECGLKGFSVGGAAVSTKHAGFVINTGNATTADILSLCEAVHDKVLHETGFELEMEVEIMQ